MTLLELCYNKPDLILLESANCLIREQLPHYKQITPDQITNRFKRLFDATVKCIESNSIIEIEKFMKQVSDERYESGYELVEVQKAINILEECLWRKITEFVDADKQINVMKFISSTLCKAKRALTDEYALLSREYIFD